MAEDPKSIGRYRITDVLGRGAMGVIYKAHDPDIDRLVAIKLIRTDLLDGNDRADFIARFRREAQVSARCAHPNIVSIFDFSLHEGDPFLVMEFIDGATLVQAWPASGRFAVEDAIFLMLQLLTALQAAHAMGIVHRDIKPANIMLTGGTMVKVTDFGISRVESMNFTQVDTVIGTPSYMSPEQCRGEMVDQRSDLFSAGIMLFEMLAGQKPFVGRNAVEVFSKLLNEPPPDLAQLAPEVPDGVRRVIERCLAKLPADRFASANDMAAALREAAVAHGAAYADRTIIMPPRAPMVDPTPSRVSTTGSFDPDLVTELTRQLTVVLGPIATLLVRSAVRKADSVEALCAALAANIDQPEARARFEQDMRQRAARSPTMFVNRATMISSGDFSAAELERLQKALAAHLGPFARVLIKRAAASAPSLPALWQAVALHIDDAKARAAFLRGGPAA